MAAGAAADAGRAGSDLAAVGRGRRRGSTLLYPRRGGAPYLREPSRVRDRCGSRSGTPPRRRGRRRAEAGSAARPDAPGGRRSAVGSPPGLTQSKVAPLDLRHHGVVDAPTERPPRRLAREEDHRGDDALQPPRHDETSDVEVATGCAGVRRTVAYACVRLEKSPLRCEPTRATCETHLLQGAMRECVREVTRYSGRGMPRPPCWRWRTWWTVARRGGSPRPPRPRGASDGAGAAETMRAWASSWMCCGRRTGALQGEATAPMGIAASTPPGATASPEAPGRCRYPPGQRADQPGLDDPRPPRRDRDHAEERSDDVASRTTDARGSAPTPRAR